MESKCFQFFLPDGRRFLYVTAGSTPERNGIYAGSLDGTEDRRILADVSSNVVFAPGLHGSRLSHVLFVREDTLVAQPFDAGSAQLAGDVFPVADGVAITIGVSYAPAAVSDSGVLLYSPGSAAGGAQIDWYDRTGKLLGPVVLPGVVAYPAVSPDEKSVAFMRANGSFSLTDL